MNRKLLALLLVFCLCFSLGIYASAESAHDHENQLIWSFDEASGELYISGTGTVAPISSVEEQPWAEYREQIRYVYIDQEAMYFVEDIAYWFSGCTDLVYAEIPGYWFVIGEDAFRDCANLQELLILTHGTPEIADSAFAAENPADLWIMVTGDESEAYVQTANWHGRTIDVANYGVISAFDGPCGIKGCSCTSCTYTYAYDQYDEYYHWKYAVCTNCSADEYAYGGRWEHTYNASGVCTVCGYMQDVTPCTHPSYRSEYSGSGCTFYRYCSTCGEYIGSSEAHPGYDYGDWTPYSENIHRRTVSCTRCSYSTYHFGDHSLGYEAWTTHSATQHTRTRNCYLCGYTEVEYENHFSISGGNFCDGCGCRIRASITWDAQTNGGTINGEGTFTNINSVGYVPFAPNTRVDTYTPVKTGYVFTGWFTLPTGGVSHEALTVTEDQTFYAQFEPAVYTITFDPGAGSIAVAAKTVTYGSTYGDLPIPTRDNYAFDGWFTAEEGGTQITADTPVDITADQTLYAHWTQMISFSVTVPTSLPLVMDAEGNICASDASIFNHSTGDVTVSAISLQAENGWTIVPYATDMAHQKVDAKAVGLRINGAVTAASGQNESLTLAGNWTIPRDGSLTLDYDAVISAVSQAVKEETILSAVFVLKWS